MKLKITLIIFILAGISFLFFLNFKTETYKTSCGEYKEGEVEVNSAKIMVDIADDSCKRELGLSNKASLDGEGMFFVFENSGNYGFWMKDMDFPIDILWIDKNFKIIGIEKYLLPETYPKSYGEKYFSKYVLEIPAGFSEKYNIKISDEIKFTEK